MTKFVTLSIERLNQVIGALNSYCNTGEIDCADDLVAELLAERDQKQVEQEPVANNWTVFNSGAEVASGLSLSDAIDYLDYRDRLNRDWCAVCVIDKSNPPSFVGQQREREPQFDAISVKQERLAVQFCAEIAGPRGGKPSLPDQVRLLEMAEELYRAEVNLI